jgi:hypothetical protein
VADEGGSATGAAFDADEEADDEEDDDAAAASAAPCLACFRKDCSACKRASMSLMSRDASDDDGDEDDEVALCRAGIDCETESPPNRNEASSCEWTLMEKR